jgi:hypothetical protein
MKTDGTIIYQWITFQDAALSKDFTGAVACKIEAGKIGKTQADQWIGQTNMSSTSTEVQGKYWYKQNKDTKLAADKTEYRALFWNTAIFDQKVSERAGYSTQQCEIEIELDKNATPPTTTIDLVIGARFYKNKDATTFFTTPETEFEWYREEMTYSAELEIVPVYENKQETQLEEKAFEIDPANLDTERIQAVADFKAAKIAAEEAAAAAAATPAVTPAGGRQVVRQATTDTFA